MVLWHPHFHSQLNCAFLQQTYRPITFDPNYCVDVNTISFDYPLWMAITRAILNFYFYYCYFYRYYSVNQSMLMIFWIGIWPPMVYDIYLAPLPKYPAIPDCLNFQIYFLYFVHDPFRQQYGTLYLMSERMQLWRTCKLMWMNAMWLNVYDWVYFLAVNCTVCTIRAFSLPLFYVDSTFAICYELGFECMQSVSWSSDFAVFFFFLNHNLRLCMLYIFFLFLVKIRFTEWSIFKIRLAFWELYC